jgi:hypothetical protein
MKAADERFAGVGKTKCQCLQTWQTIAANVAGILGA